MQDPRWGNLDPAKKNDFLAVAFDMDIGADPRWKSLAPDLQNEYRKTYLDEAFKVDQAAAVEAAPERRGFFGRAGSALARGTVRTIESAGQALELADLTPREADIEKGILDKAGRGIVDWSQRVQREYTFLKQDKGELLGEPGFIQRGLIGIPENIPQTLPIIAGAWGGAKVGAGMGGVIAGPPGAAVGTVIGSVTGAIASLVAIFGAGNYGQEYSSAYQELGRTRPEATEEERREVAHRVALRSAALEVGTEIPASLLGLRMVGGTKVLTQPLVATLRNILTKPRAEFAKEFAAMAAGEIGGEMITGGGQAWARQVEGLSGPTITQGITEAIIPTMGMSVFFGGAAAGYNRSQTNRAMNELNSDNVRTRVDAINTMTYRLAVNTQDKDLALAWRGEALKSVEAGEKFDFDEKVIEFAKVKTAEDYQEKPEAPFDPSAISAATNTDEALEGFVKTVESGKPVPDSLDPLRGADPGLTLKDLAAVPADQAQRMLADEGPELFAGQQVDYTTPKGAQRVTLIEQNEDGTWRGKTKDFLDITIRPDRVIPVPVLEPGRQIEYQTKRGTMLGVLVEPLGETAWRAKQLDNGKPFTALIEKMKPITAFGEILPEARKEAPSAGTIRGNEGQVLPGTAGTLAQNAQETGGAGGGAEALLRQRTGEGGENLQQPAQGQPGGAVRLEINELAHEAATSPKNELPEPSLLQKEAGNYKKGHLTFEGFDISIENPEGSKRTGVSPDGKTWENSIQKGHYGYIKGTVGKDKDHIDTFVSTAPREGSPVFVVDQVNPKTGTLDEHKAMLGYSTIEEAKDAYLSNYEKGWKGLGAITETTVEDFREWTVTGDQKKGFAEAAPQIPKPRDIEWKSRKSMGLTFHTTPLEGDTLVIQEMPTKGKNKFVVYKKSDGPVKNIGKFTTLEEAKAAGETIIPQASIRVTNPVHEEILKAFDEHLAKGDITPDLHAAVKHIIDIHQEHGIIDTVEFRKDATQTTDGRKLLFDLRNPEDVKFLLRYGFTKEEIDGYRKRNDPIRIYGECIQHRGAGQDNWQEIRLYSGARAEDAYHEFGHSLINRGLVDPGPKPAGVSQYAHEEAAAWKIANDLVAGKEVPNVRKRPGVVRGPTPEAGKGTGKAVEPGRQGSIRATPEGRERQYAISKRPEGHKVTAPAESYPRGVGSKGNVWVRQSDTDSNEGRQLLVQFSNKLINKDFGPDEASRYNDEVYGGKREGYDRLQDFWEIPQWMGFISKSLPNADVYVVRDMAEAKKFLKAAGYDRIAFSAIDVNKVLIHDLSADFKGKIDIGGYTVPGTFDDIKNAKWHENLESLAKDVGVSYTEGVDYRHFEGSEVIPRLTMSQGCLHKCAFCTVPKLLTETSTAVIDQQAEAFGALKTKLVYLNDKTFGQAKNYKHLENVYTAMKKANPNFKGFIIQTTGTQLLKMDDAWLQRSGIKYVELGVETYNDAILKSMHKPHNTGILDKAVQKLRENKIALIPNVIIGLPGETRETYQRTLDFLDRNKDVISHYNVNNLALYTGTELTTTLGGPKVKADLDENQYATKKSFHTEEEAEAAKEFAEKVYAKGVDEGQFSVRESLDEYKPKIAAQYAAMIRTAFERMVKKFGPGLKGIYNAVEGRHYRETISAAVETAPQATPFDRHPVKSISEERLAKIADKYAEATTDTWKGKIEGKIGELDGAEVKHLDGYRFLISGTRDGREISIEQDMIINVSSLGKMFNQFPARIYVDGKFTPESKYKEMFPYKGVKKPHYSIREEIAEIKRAAKKNGTYMKAPGGFPTLLEERLWAVVRTENFKSWFGDWESGNIWGRDDVSKVVDKNDEPLVVYHGTQKGGFSVFDPDKRDSHATPSTFFTSNERMASTYAGSRNEIALPEIKTQKDLEDIGWEFEQKDGYVAIYEPEGYLHDEAPTLEAAVAIALDQQENLPAGDERGLYPVFLNIRNPEEMDFEGANWDGQRYEQYNVIDDEGENVERDGRIIFPQEEADKIAEETGGTVESAGGVGLSTNDVVRDAKRNGSDGAIIRNVTDDGGKSGYYSGVPADVFVIFKPEQAKSATWNIGTFDPKNVDARYSVRKDGRSLGARILAGIEKPNTNVKPIVPLIAAHLSGESAKEGVIDYRTAGPKENRQVETALADMLEASVMKHPESLGWYREDIERTMSILQQIHPELKNHSDNLWMRIAIAVTSDGNNTLKNMELAESAYKAWKITGSVVIPIATRRGATITENLRFAEEVRKGFKTDREFEKWLLGKAPAGEIAGDLVAKIGMDWEDAKAIVKDENLDSIVPRAIIFGPKIGAFFSNLSGDFSPVTTDMWFMRTMGRIQGNLMEGDTPEEIAAQIKRLRTAIKNSPRGVRAAGIEPSLFGKYTDEDLDQIAKTIARKSGPGGEKFRLQLRAIKGGDELRNAANFRADRLQGGATKDSPDSGAHRQWLRDRVEGTRKMLEKRGIEYENADIQAAVWIGEKEIYHAYGAKQTQGDYFSDGANALYEKLHGRPSELYAGTPGEVGRRSRTGPETVPLFAIRQIDTPEFKKWFGDSKVVDENGNPLVVYHGTRHDFDAFTIGEEGAFFAAKPSVAGVFTLKDPEESYTDFDEGARIIPVYLSIENPLVITPEEYLSAKAFGGKDIGDRYEAEEAGYDGIRITPNKNFGPEWSADVWVAFSPEQIKSATGNIGTFDETNPDIRYSVRESIKDKMLRLIIDNPAGFTIDVTTGEMVTKGWTVAPTKRTATPVETITPKVIDDFLERFKHVFDADKRAFLGGWYADDPKSKDYRKYVLDVAFVVDNYEDAAYIADIGETPEEKQDGIFSLDEKRYVRTEDAIAELKESRVYNEGRRAELGRIQEELHRIIQEGRDVDRGPLGQPEGLAKGEVRYAVRKDVTAALKRDPAAGAPTEFKNKEVSLTHWSKEKNLTFTDPEKYGTGYAGAERKNRDAFPELWIPKTFTGYGKYEAEPGLGPYRYQIKVPGNRLYDAWEDPLNLYPSAEETRKMGYYTKAAQGLIHEQRIKEAGFRGYVSTPYNVVALFEKEKVIRVPVNEQVLPQAEQQFTIREIKWDTTTHDAIGIVPDQIELNYKGFTVPMTPTAFRSLVPEGRMSETTPTYIKEAIEKEEPIAPPWLAASWDETRKMWKVNSHEGRSRSDAAAEIAPNEPMPVSILLDGGLRARDLTDEMRSAKFIPQGGGRSIDPRISEPQYAARPPVVFAETTTPITVQDYTQNRAEAGMTGKILGPALRQTKEELSLEVSKLIAPISTRLKYISPELSAKLRRLDRETLATIQGDRAIVAPLLNKAKAMTRADALDWDYARKNSDTAKIDELVQRYGMQREYTATRKMFDDLRDAAIDTGLDIGEIEEYWTRKVKDLKGLYGEMNREELGRFSKALAEKAASLGMTVDQLDPDMRATVITNVLFGGPSGPGGVSATKERKFIKIPPRLNKYYLNSDAAVLEHIGAMRTAIEKRKFFGKIPEKVAEMRRQLYSAQAKVREYEQLIRTAVESRELNKAKHKLFVWDGEVRLLEGEIWKYTLQRDYTDNIGVFIDELIVKGDIKASQENDVSEMLHARFNERGTHGFWQLYKNFSYMDTMGSPISALTQIGDLAWAMYEGGLIGGLKHAGKSLMGTSIITREDIGISRIAEEFADQSKLGTAVTWVFKHTGLEKMDAIGKEALLNASLEKNQKLARENPQKLAGEIKHIFGDETDDTIQALRDGVITENVKMLVYSRLADFQPVGLSEMPQRYLTSGNGRIFYMLKTFTIKQFDAFRNEAIHKITHGDRAEKIQGLKNLVRLAMFFVLANAAADELKDLVLGRTTDYSDRLVDNILRLFGSSKFVTWTARTEGAGSAFAKQVLPPFKFIDSLTKDIYNAGDNKGLELTASVPLLGKLAYWHLGRGTTKRADIWDIRFKKYKAKVDDVHEDFEKAKDKQAFLKEHREEMAEYRRKNMFQGRLNNFRKIINKLKSQPEQTDSTKKRIEQLETRRIELIKNFLEKKETGNEQKW